MPPNDDPNNPDPVTLLQQQVEQLTRENSFLREERNTLENLVVSNLPAGREAHVTPNGDLALKPKPGESAEPQNLSVDAIVERVVQKVDEKLIQPRDRDAAKAKAVQDLNALAQNPKTKDVVLYIDEMRAVARQYPNLDIGSVYKLAKADAGPKQFPPANQPKAEDLRTNPIRPAAGADRFSEAGKMKTREQVDTRREAAFKSSFEDAWDSVMAGKAE